MILFAERILLPGGEVRPDGVLVLQKGGIERVSFGAQAVRRAARSNRERILRIDGLLAPGLINAHAHLELGAMHGRVSPPVLSATATGPARGAAFVEWLGGVLRQHRQTPAAAYGEGVRAGAARLLASGTTTVGDIASTPRGWRASRAALRSVVFREALDAGDPTRTMAVLTTAARPLPKSAKRARRTEGISPHAPYTVSPDLLGGLARLATRRTASGAAVPIPLQIHWAETESEERWLRKGSGPFADILSRSPRRSGLDLLEEAGLLTERTSLVHGNHPGRGEVARLAERGIPLVHCPGSHAFFEREPFPWARYRRSGVPLALGTDSLASNAELDMRREMALLSAAEPGLDPREVVAAATVGGARALGLLRVTGALQRGLRADLVQHELPGGTAETEVLEVFAQGRTGVSAVWVDGRSVRVSCPLA